MHKLRQLKLVLYALGLIFLRALKVVTRLITKNQSKQNLYIKWWFGELGNNLIQLAHAEYLSEKLGLSIYTPSHKFLKVGQKYGKLDESLIDGPIKDYGPTNQGMLLFEMKSSDSSASELKQAFLRGCYFQYDVLPLVAKLQDYRSILRDKILPLIPHWEDPSIGDETLVIHLRSGDVFNPDYVHPAYVQPSLSFYSHILNKFQFKEVVVVTQVDRRNPCIEELQKLRPDVRVQTGSLLEDVSTILTARHLVTGLSSFSVTLAFCSQKIQNLYIPQFDCKPTYWRVIFWPKLMRLFLKSTEVKNQTSGLDFTIHPIKLFNYIAIGTWHNSPEQRQQMLTQQNVI